jgi:hypothetical protein
MVRGGLTNNRTNIMTNIYEVIANAAASIIIAETDADARDLFAIDAGYQSESDMTDRLEHPSEIVARELTTATEIMAAMENAGIDGDQDWGQESTAISVIGGTVIVSGSDFEIRA